MTSRVLVLTAAVLLSGCPQETPEVAVNTYVGKSYVRADPELAREAAAKVWAAIADEVRSASPDAPAIEATVTTHPPVTASAIPLPMLVLP